MSKMKLYVKIGFLKWNSERSERLNRQLTLQAAFLVSCTLLHGCFCSSYRTYTLVSVADIGDRISTTHTYRVKSIDGKFDVGMLKEEFPNVFSDTGIPIVLRISMSGGAYKYGWSQALAAFSLTLFPVLYHSDTERTIEIIMVDDDTMRDRFVVTDASEYTEGVLPTALIPFAGVPEHGNMRVYWRRDSVVGTESTVRKARGDFHNDCPDFTRRGFAYGIAVRLKGMEDSGVVDAMLKKMGEAKTKIPAHRIERLVREPGKGFSYHFSIELLKSPDDMDKVLPAVVRELGEQFKEEYADTHPGVRRSSLVVDFLGLKGEGNMITGRVVVLAIEPESLSYDPVRRRGKISVRFNSGQYEEARTWAKKNIKTLARDKNIALTTGQQPPEATYYSLGEKVEGNVMEIEFKTE